MLRRACILVQRLSNGCNIAAEWLLASVSLGMAGVILLQVFFRYALNNSLFWSEELGRMLLVWLTFIGASVAYKRGAHVGVSLLVERMRPSLRELTACLTHSAGAMLFFVMFFHGLKFFEMLAPQMTVSLGVSRQIPFLAVPLAGGLMLLHSVSFICNHVLNLSSKDDAQ